MLSDAKAKVSADDLDANVDALQRVVDRYPGTVAAREAHDEIVLYRGMQEAVRTDAWETAQLLVVATARALDRYRAREGAWPENLDRLTPRWLDDLPVDPWGEPLHYRRTDRGYVLACKGSDRALGGSGDADDLWVENGRFVREPSEGAR